MLVWRIAAQQECFTIKKTCTRKANWEEAMPAGEKEKMKKMSAYDEYFANTLAFEEYQHTWRTLHCTC